MLPLELGGDGNGILAATNDLSLHSCRLSVNWILKRLKAGGLSGQEMQSLAWLMPNASNAAADLETGKYFRLLPFFSRYVIHDHIFRN